MSHLSQIQLFSFPFPPQASDAGILILLSLAVPVWSPSGPDDGQAIKGPRAGAGLRSRPCLLKLFYLFVPMLHLEIEMNPERSVDASKEHEKRAKYTNMSGFRRFSHNQTDKVRRKCYQTETPKQGCVITACILQKTTCSFSSQGTNNDEGCYLIQRETTDFHFQSLVRSILTEPRLQIPLFIPQLYQTTDVDRQPGDTSAFHSNEGRENCERKNKKLMGQKIIKQFFEPWPDFHQILLVSETRYPAG